MNDENTPRDYSRSAIIVFRLVLKFCRFPIKRQYADSRTRTALRPLRAIAFAIGFPPKLRFCGASHGLGCPPRTSLTPGFPVEKPAVSDATTGLNLSIFRFPPHGRPSDRGQLSLPDVNYTKFTGLKSQLKAFSSP